MPKTVWCQLCKTPAAAPLTIIAGQTKKKLLFCADHRRLYLTGKIDVTGKPKKR